MRTLTLGFCALACTVALVATTATSATAEPRGQRNWNKAEGSGWRDSHRGYGSTVDTVGRPSIMARTTTTPTTILRIRTTTLLLPTMDQASASRLGSKL
jgi:hypothetical protein